LPKIENSALFFQVWDFTFCHMIGVIRSTCDYLKLLTQLVPVVNVQHFCHLLEQEALASPEERQV